MSTFDLSKRLISLDALRGFTIALMIIVNTPGSWSHLYWPLAHAEWHGITITDFVFPFFLFIVGVSIVLSNSKMLDKGVEKSVLRKKIIVRALKIFGLGLFLSLFPYFNFAELRVAGVLQRIAIVYMICALIFLCTDWKMQLKIGVGTVVAYWLMMVLIPLPQFGAGILEPGKNLAAYIDSILMPGRMYQGTWDPEGILSTLPAIGTGISGMLAGHLLKWDSPIYKKLSMMFLVGFVCVLIGYFWDLFFPFNKNLWSSSYVLFTSGWGFMAFAASILVVDVMGYKKITQFGVIYGSNAITIYVLSGLLTRLMIVFNLKSGIYEGILSLVTNPKMASFIFAVAFMLFCYIPAYIMYKKKIFIKV